MLSTDLKEKQMLREWAKCHEENGFDCIEVKDTYFRDRDGDDTYLMEYDFSTIADLELLIEKVCMGSIPKDVGHMLAVAAFKEMPGRPGTEQIIGSVQVENIPEFIYVF